MISGVNQAGCLASIDEDKPSRWLTHDTLSRFKISSIVGEEAQPRRAFQSGGPW